MAATATLTLLLIGADDVPAVEIHPGVRAAVAAAVSALEGNGTGHRAAIAVGEAAPDAIRSSATYLDATALFHLAAPGELLLSSTAAAVLGPHRYRLIKRGEGITAVEWQAARRVAPLPPFLGKAEQFVGRAAELEQVMATVDAVQSGGTRRLLLRGESGIGKTALAGAVAARARQRGFTVLAGRCIEELALSYQPIAEALHPVVDAMDATEVAGWVGPTAPYLAALFPKLGPLPRAGAEEARELLRHALRALLVAVVESAPTLLVIDDIQWAPRPTLELLDELHRDAAPSLLQLGTQRVGDGRENVWAVDDTTTIVDVGPLSFDDTVALVGLHSRRLASQSSAVREIHRQSAGNPFLVEELALHVGEAGEAGALPASVREVVLRRVGLLAPDAVDVLTTAAIVGAPFDAALLARITGEPEDGIDYVLESARRAGLLVTAHDGYEFKHSLARDALYESLTATRRRMVHGRIADAAGDRAELRAYHLAASATRDTLDRVVSSAWAAVDTEAPEWAGDPRPVLRRALQALELDPRPRRDRAELLHWLSSAEYNAGERDTPWKTAELAANEARAVGDLHLFAKAISNMGHTMSNDAAFERFEALAEDALAIEDADDEVIAYVTQVLASHLSWRGNDIARATRLMERGWQSAARLDDETIQRQALAIRAEVLAGTPHIAERLRVTEQYAAAQERADAGVLVGGFAYRAGALLAAGRRDEFDAACDMAARYAEERPWWKTEEVALLLKACRSLLDGELLGTLMMISHELGTFADEGISPFVSQAALIWRENGRTMDLIPLIEAIPKSESTSRIAPALLLLAHAELGNTEPARALLAEVARDDYADLYRTYARGVALAMAAEACWHLGDAEQARALVTHLRPYGGQLIVIPPCAAAFGAADYFLGLLADTYGDRDTAIARLEAAIALTRRVRAPLLERKAVDALARILESASLDEA